MVRHAGRLTGPWSTPQTVLTADEFPGLYGCFFTPQSMTEQEPAVLISAWIPYNVAMFRLEVS